MKKKTLFINEKLLNSNEVRILRQYLIKSAALAPQPIYDFCILFQEVDNSKLNEFSKELNNKQEVF